MIRFINFLVGFAIGVILGCAIATLLVPESGVATQERLRARIQEALEEARRAAETTRAEAHIRLAELKAKQADQ